MWPNQYKAREEHKRVISECGCPFEPIYHPVIDKETGHYELEIDKLQKRNVYDEIQSYADACDVHKIIQRFTNGEIDVLNKVQGIYGDLVSMPKNIYEFMDLEAKASEHFDRLPTDIKERFDNSYLQYVMLANSNPDEFFSRHEIENPYKKEKETSGEGVDG